MTNARHAVSEDAHGRGRRRSRRTIAIAALVVVAVLLAVAAGVMGWLLASRAGDDATRAEAMRSASTQIQSLLSYDGAKLDDSERVIDATTTGGFHDDYKRLFDETVRPNAQRLGARTTARVVATGWVGARGPDATVLAFVNQSTTTNQGERVDTVQAQVTMREVDGRWLIAGLDQA